MEKILVIGAGLTGAIVARELACAGYVVDVFEARPHVAGNCYTKTDSETGIMVHEHGPHIFHTDNEEVWKYVQTFAEFMPYLCQVKATTKGCVYSLPINLLTINQFFSKTFSPAEARAFIKSKAENIAEIRSFEDQALGFFGKELYEAFFYGYPIKQWGIKPTDLPASILKRLPLRFDYNDNYFNHKYQGMPLDGYTVLIERILKHENINVFLNRKFERCKTSNYEHIFYTGTLDGWFGYRLGHLGYRTLRFEASRHDGDFQGCAVMSYPEESVPYTRITEHKHFTPWQKFNKTIVFHEYSSFCGKTDIPYYPIRLVEEKRLLSDYVALANLESGVTFMGRLGTYRYLDMDVSVYEALEGVRQFLNLKKNYMKIPSFFNHPL